MKINIYNTNIYEETITELSKLIKGTQWENKVFLVGGAVRDLIMHKPIKDIDICVMMENGGIKFAEWVCKETGCYHKDSNPCIFEAYGTAKFNIRTIHKISNVDIECVHTRKEQYHDKTSRNPSTEYGTIKEDSERRDLTINALYLNISSFDVIDPTNKGLDDIEEQILRVPTDPSIVYSDDPLRMLRAIRFSAKLGWGIEKNTWVGIVKNKNRINIISQERITEEINKILISDRPSYGIKKLDKCGLLKIVLPEIYDLKGIEHSDKHFGDVFEHTMEVLDKTKPILINRLAGLFHDCGKPYNISNINGTPHFYGHETTSAQIVEEVMKKMKYSNSEIKKVAIAIKNHMRFKNSGDNCPSNKAVRKFISDVGEENVGLTLDLIDADNKSHSKEYSYENQVSLIKNKIYEFNKEAETKENNKIPINGTDIMKKFNLKSSPVIGKYLRIVEDSFYENPNITKEECLKIVEKLLTV